ncbi:hypothetical protein HDU83_002630 [Entophlyctis luteolus]|nr:hypothetical protein HDU83_002630 [Entophlyctis luteolus]
MSENSNPASESPFDSDFWAHPDTVTKRAIARTLSVRPVAASLRALRDTHRLHLFDALEVLAMILVESSAEDLDFSCEDSPDHAEIVSILLRFGRSEPSAPKNLTLLWSMHPYLLAMLARNYFRIYHAYLTILIAWTRREVRGMISMALPHDSRAFSLEAYLWVTSGCIDVAGFSWPATKSAKHGCVLLARVAQLKNRWRTLVLYASEHSRAATRDIMAQQIRWLRADMLEAEAECSSRDHRDLTPEEVADCAAMRAVSDDGGFSSLILFWESFFDQVVA